jgi:hypothetical protein
MLKVEFDTNVLKRKFSSLEKKQLPFAMTLAINYTARDMANALKGEIRRTYDRPKTFTVEGVFIRGAKVGQINAVIYLRDEAVKGTPPVKYLAPTVYGGHRRVKRFERALRATGAIRGDEVAVPAIGAKVDQYGNVPSGTIVQMLSSLGSNPSGANTPKGGYRRRGKKKRPDWFVGEGAKGQRMIFRAKAGGRDIEPVFILVKGSDVSYGKEFAFFDVAKDTFRRTFKRNWANALKYAMSTAK